MTKNSNIDIKEQLRLNAMMYHLSQIRGDKWRSILRGVVHFEGDKRHVYKVEISNSLDFEVQGKVSEVNTDEGERLPHSLRDLLIGLDNNAIKLCTIHADKVVEIAHPDKADIVYDTILLISEYERPEVIQPYEGKYEGCAYLYNSGDEFALPAYDLFCSKRKNMREYNEFLANYVRTKLVEPVLSPNSVLDYEWSSNPIKPENWEDYTNSYKTTLSMTPLNGFEISRNGKAEFDLVYAAQRTDKYEMRLDLWLHDLTTENHTCVYWCKLLWPRAEKRVQSFDCKRDINCGYMRVLADLRKLMYDRNSESYTDFLWRLPVNDYPDQRFIITACVDMNDDTQRNIDVSANLRLHYDDVENLFIDIRPSKKRVCELAATLRYTYCSGTGARFRIESTYLLNGAKTDESDDSRLYIPLNSWNSLDRSEIFRTIVKMAEDKREQMLAKKRFELRSATLEQLLGPRPVVELTDIDK